MPWRKLAELSPEFGRYLNYAVVVLSLTAEILRAYLRSRAIESDPGREDAGRG